MRISRLLNTLMVAGAIIVTTSASSMAQPPGGGGGGRRMGGMGGFGLGSLLSMSEVQKELKVDGDQIKELETLQKETQEEVAKIFPPPDRNAQPGQRGGPGGGGGPGRFGADPAKMAELTAVQNKAEDKLADILDPAQMKRLMGLLVQRDGIRNSFQQSHFREAQDHR